MRSSQPKLKATKTPSITTTTGKRSRRASKVLNVTTPASARQTTKGLGAYEGPIYVLEQIYEAAQALPALTSETHQFTTPVQSYRVSGSDKVGRDKVATVPSVDITFFKETGEFGVEWRFDGALVFAPSQLRDGENPAGVELLASEAGRQRLGEIIKEATAPWFTRRLMGLDVTSGFMRGDNLVAVVSLIVVNEQVAQFVDLQEALAPALEHLIHEVEQVVRKRSGDTLPVRTAIERARIALERVQAAASTDWQKAMWRAGEELLARLEAVARKVRGPLRPSKNELN